MKAKHFKLYELIPKATYEDFGEFAWHFLDERAVSTLDEIRDFFGVPVTVNNWKWGGKLQYRGLRTDAYYLEQYSAGNFHGTYSEFISTRNSQHRFGRAFDFDVQGLAADSVRAALIDTKKQGLFQHLTRMELTTSWIHIDVANTQDPSIIETFYP